MRALASLVLAALGTLAARRADAETRSGAPPEPEYSLSVHGETHAALFQRALLPGAYGAVIADETALPIYQYVQLAARDLRIVREQVGMDMELSAWWRGELGSAGTERPSDGDVQTANVGYRRGPLAFRLGRQHVAGGAARYARFDGALLDAELGAGFDLRMYAGLSVLPRWNERARFTYLGAAADSQLRDPSVFAGPRDRSDYGLGGARLGWATASTRSGLSFHEQHESGGLTRRTLTLDQTTQLSGSISAGLSASAELEAERFSELRGWLDASPSRALDLSLEWLHAEPALFLSRQSVLSVFSAADYDEGGGRAVIRVNERLSVESGGWAELYSGSHPGARCELAVRAIANRAGTAFVRVAYARVLTPDNGYHALRSSLTRGIVPKLSGTLEAYAYLYDRAIARYRSSSVYSGTLEYRPVGAVGVLWGASLVRSPYANLDAQTQLRLAYDFDFATIRGRR